MREDLLNLFGFLSGSKTNKKRRKGGIIIIIILLLLRGYEYARKEFRN